MSNSAVLRGKVSRCKSATEFPRKCGRCVKIERQNFLGKIVAATDFPRKFCRATKFPSDRISCDTGTTLLRSCLCRSAVAVRPFAHLRILYAGPGCKSGPAGFKAGQAFTAVYNRASRLYSRPARFKTGRPAIKPAAGFQAGQVYNRALTYICTKVPYPSPRDAYIYAHLTYFTFACLPTYFAYFRGFSCSLQLLSSFALHALNTMGAARPL